MYVISLRGLWRPIVEQYATAADALSAYHQLCAIWSSALIAMTANGLDITYTELCAMAQFDHRQEARARQSASDLDGSARVPLPPLLQ